MISSELISKVRKLEIRTRRMVDEITAGAYHSVFKGSGIEFEEVRPYTSDDDVRDIDWNVTAKMGEPYVKKYVEERELTVMLLVDSSASGRFGSAGKTKGETAIEIGALLAFSAIRNNDKVGLLLFTDKSELFLPPKSGRIHTLRLIRELIARKPENSGTDIGAALENMMRILRKKAVIFIISDFIDDPGKYEKLLNVANKRHDVVAIRVLDNIEFNMPLTGSVFISDSENGDVCFYRGGKAGSGSFRKAAEELHGGIRKVCTRSKVDLVDIRCGEDFVKPLMSFFRKRERMANRTR